MKREYLNEKIFERLADGACTLAELHTEIGEVGAQEILAELQAQASLKNVTCSRQDGRLVWSLHEDFDEERIVPRIQVAAKPAQLAEKTTWLERIRGAIARSAERSLTGADLHRIFGGNRPTLDATLHHMVQQGRLSDSKTRPNRYRLPGTEERAAAPIPPLADDGKPAISERHPPRQEQETIAVPLSVVRAVIHLLQALLPKERA